MSRPIDASAVPTLSYPRQFFDFYGGTHIFDAEINRLIRECVTVMELDESKRFTSRAVGEATVIVHRLDDPDLKYHVVVARNYQSGYIRHDGTSEYGDEEEQ